MRHLIGLLAAAFSLLTLAAGCSRDASGGAAGSGEVVLYSSADAEFLKLITDAFTAETGIRVRTAGDTEATKTTGLVQRLLAERNRPRADVWWSSEALGTVELSRAGVLEPYISADAEARFPADPDGRAGGWPAHLRSDRGDWYGFALRARVIVYNTDRLTRDQIPPDASGLAAFGNRFGIARPQFGTTRSHVGAIAATRGQDALESWLGELRAAGVRIYDGNMAVVRAVASGEIDLGMTDTDDVWVGQRNGWPVDLVYADSFPSPPAPPFPNASSAGAGGVIVMPNTVAIVRGGPNAHNARRFMAYLLSPEAERILANSDSRNIPVNPTLQEEFAHLRVPTPATVEWEDIADAIGPAMETVERALTR